MQRLKTFIGVLTIILCFGVKNTALADQREPIHLGEIHTLQSTILDEERSIWVYAPAGYENTGKKYPVIYLIDASNDFHHLVGTMRFLARNSKLPEMIVVGVTNADRTRDLTPPITEQMLDAKGDPVPERPTAGGADNFLTFFEKELFPYVEENYPTAPYRLLAGHSYGGLLALHSFVNHNELFQGYIAASPSLWWNNGKLISEAETFLKSNKMLNNSLFVTVGNEGGDMLSNYRKFVEMMSGNVGENIVWGARHLQEETHGTVILRSYYQGLEKIFEGWTIPNETMTAGLDAIKGHFAKLSDRMGYMVMPSPTIINTSGFRALNAGKNKEAIDIFSYNAARFPEAPGVQDSLGAAYEANGQLEAAKVQYKKAVDLATKQNNRGLEFFKIQYKKITEKIAGN